MSRLEKLVSNYQRLVSLPWQPNLHGTQKVWFAVYDKTEERRIRSRVGGFELATTESGHSWVLVDLTDAFPTWMAQKEYRDDYFLSPLDLETAMADFLEQTASTLRSALTSEQATEGTVVAVLGVGSLFGFIKVSDLLQKVYSDIRGRLLVFFPGEYDDNTYRLLDARDGWNYRAVPITHHEGVLEP